MPIVKNWNFSKNCPIYPGFIQFGNFHQNQPFFVQSHVKKSLFEVCLKAVQN